MKWNREGSFSFTGYLPYFNQKLITTFNHILIQCQYIYSHRKVCNYFCNCTGRKASDWTKNTKATEPCKV